MHRAEYAFDVAVSTTTTRLSPYALTIIGHIGRKACKLLILIVSVGNTMCIVHKLSKI